jgi:hypothetical protein
MTIGLLKCGFSSYDLFIIEENATLSFHVNIGGDISGTLLLSAAGDWSCLP